MPNMIPTSEFFARIERLQANMKRDGYDLILCYGNEAEPQYARYLCDYWPSFETAGVLVPAEGEAILLIGPESLSYASDRSRLPKIRQLKAFRESSDPEYPGKKLDTFTSVFEEALGHMPKKFGVAGYSLMTIGVFEALKEALGDTPILNASNMLNELRMIKTEPELICMREAADITHKTFDYLLENIRPGMTECQVAGMALGKMHELGAERESYPVWVLTGEGSHQAISRPRHKVIQPGDMTFIQIGARVDGYASSIGRPVVFGKANDEQKSLIGAGYKLYDTVTAALKAGVPACDVALLHKKTLDDLGYGDHFLYGPLHGNGTMEGEAPWVETNADFVLQENMTFCLDLYMGSEKTKRGLRMEDVIRITKDGIENLTDYPRKLFEL